jgi:putative protease
MVEKKLVGKVTHYFTKIGVAVVELSDTLKIGDKISIEGATTNFEQEVESMQIEHEPVEEAKKGDSIGLKVKDRVREGDSVYKIIEETSE